MEARQAEYSTALETQLTKVIVLTGSFCSAERGERHQILLPAAKHGHRRPE